MRPIRQAHRPGPVERRFARLRDRSRRAAQAIDPRSSARGATAAFIGFFLVAAPLLALPTAAGRLGILQASSPAQGAGVTPFDPSDPGLHGLSLTVYDETGNVDNETYPTTVQYPDVPNPVGAVTCATLAATRLDFDWGRGSGPAGCPIDNFSIYGTGTIVAPITGTVSFCTSNDDGMYVEIGSEPGIGDWGFHGVGEPCNNEGSMSMVAGVSYPITVWYFEGGNDAALRLFWKYDALDWTIVPGEPGTVTVSPSGRPGRVTSSDGVIDCTWDGSVATGTCSETTSGSLSLTPIPADPVAEVAWSGDCARQGDGTCVASNTLVASTVEVAFSPPCGVLGNLLQNCGFESNDFSSWDGDGQRETVDARWDPTHAGDYGAVLAPWDGVGSISQTISVTAGDQYQVRYFARQPNTLCPGCSLDVQLDNGAGRETRIQRISPISDWTAFTYTFTAASTSATVSWRGVSWNGGWYLDDISVVDLGPSPDANLTVGVPEGGSVDSGDGSIACGDRCTAALPVPTVVSLTATAEAGYAFDHWEGDCSASPGPVCSVTVDQARSVTAVFTLIGTAQVGLDGLQLKVYGQSITTDPDPGLTPCLTLSPAQLNFTWGTGSPGGTCPTDNFWAYLTGTVVSPVTGSVEFCTSNDDGMIVWVGGSFLLGDWDTHAAYGCNNTASFEMVAGHAYPVRAWFFDESEGAAMRLRWQLPGTGSTVAIPGDPVTVTVTPSGTPGSITSSDGVIDCHWDGTAATGTCSDTTTGSVTLQPVATGGSDAWAWSGECVGQVGGTCDPSLVAPSTIGVTFSAPCGVLGNRVANCGFESRNANWTRSSVQVGAWGIRYGYIRTGAYAAWFENWYGGVVTTTMSQTISVTSGDSYQVGFYAIGCGHCQFKATLTNGGSTIDQPVSNTPTDYTAYTFTFTAAASSVTLTFQNVLDNTSQAAHLDDVWLAPSAGPPAATTKALAVDATTGGSISSGDGGIACGATCSHDYTTGATVVLTASPAAGHGLVGWTGDCATATDATCTLTMSANRQVGAVFAPLLQLLADTTGGTFGTAPGPIGWTASSGGAPVSPTAIAWSGSAPTCAPYETDAYATELTAGSPAATYPTHCSGSSSASSSDGTVAYLVSYSDGSYAVGQAAPSVSYAGPSFALSNATVAFAATVSIGPCGGASTFTLTPDPTTGSGSRVYPAGSVSTAGWQPGIYAIAIAYAGDSNCASATASGSLLVGSASPGSAFGSGSVSTRRGPAAFEFAVGPPPVAAMPVGIGAAVRGVRLSGPIPSPAVSGALVWELAGQWKFSGTLTRLRTGRFTATASGSGTLWYWNAALGDWVLATVGAARVRLTATAERPGLGGQTSPATLGIRFTGKRASGAPPLPTIAQAKLSAGSIFLF